MAERGVPRRRAGGGMVGEEFIERWVRRVRREVPDAVAVFLVQAERSSGSR
jgi:hypothetical protein